MNARKQVLVVLTALMVVCSGGAMVTAASGSGTVDSGDTTSEGEYDSANETKSDESMTDETGAEADNDTTPVMDDAEVTDNETGLEEDATGQQSAYVTFEDQETDGQTVVVENVTLASGGFVTIHDSSLLVGDVVESVIGTSAYLEAGTHEQVEVTLDEPLEEDETLIAMPHRDTNDNETYDFVETEGAADGPYLTADDEPVTDQAVITVQETATDEPADDNVTEEAPTDDNVTEEAPTDDVTEEEPTDDNVTEEAPTDDNVTEEAPAEATVTFEDQTTEGETVVVEEVTLPSAGFVTIHDSSLLEGNVVGSVIGVSDYLEAGTHEQIVVTLDEPLEEDETLIAMPHQDTNDNEEYDFVETEGQEDGPFLTSENEPVTDEANVTVEDAVADEPAMEDNVTEDEPVMEDNVTEDEPVMEDNVTEEMPMDQLPVDAGDRPVFVTVQNTTIENLNVENASIYVLVVGEDISPDDLPDGMDNITEDGIPAEDNETDDDLAPIDDNETEDNETEDELEPIGDNETEDDLEPIGDNETEDDLEPIGDNETEDNETEDELEPIGDNETEDDLEPIGDNETEENETEDVADEAFNVSNLEAPASAEVGETITVTATIENPSDEERTEAAQFRLDGDLVAEQNVTLEGGESDDVEFEVDTSDLSAGDYVHMVLTDQAGEVAMLELTEATEDTETDADDGLENETNDTGTDTGDGLENETNDTAAFVGA